MRQIKEIRQGSKNCWLEIVLDEDRNRHIRELLKALKIHAFRLIHSAIGSVSPGDLKKGENRYLTSLERERILSRVNI